MPFQKGHHLAKGRSKGSKNKVTLKAEELRAKLEDEVASNWELILRDQLRDAKQNFKPRQYLIDQVIGKPKESVEISGEIGFNFDEVS